MPGGCRKGARAKGVLAGAKVITRADRRADLSGALRAHVRDVRASREEVGGHGSVSQLSMEAPGPLVSEQQVDAREARLRRTRAQLVQPIAQSARRGLAGRLTSTSASASYLSPRGKGNPQRMKSDDASAAEAKYFRC